MSNATAPPSSSAPPRSNAYQFFILVLTILSLITMVALLLPLSDETIALLGFYDNAICVIFLIDFIIMLVRAPDKRAYFFDERGWLDLIGSIPSLGFSRYTVLLRLARISRLMRVARLTGAQNRRALLRDVIANRSQYAFFVTFTVAFIVLGTTSTLVLQVESVTPGANIVTGGDALWWSFVTITTVGYGDYYPVTAAGRTIAVLAMFAGVGVIGALASILASFLVPPPPPDADALAPAPTSIEHELAALRTELGVIRQLLERT
jgi:voltage-gated potassium channel